MQPPEQTLSTAVGSCRDSAWLLVAALRNFGVAARFVSGYLVQLGEDGDDGKRGRRRRAQTGQHRSARLGGGVRAGRGLGRSRPDLGPAGRRGAHPAGGHAQPDQRGPDHRVPPDRPRSPSTSPTPCTGSPRTRAPASPTPPVSGEALHALGAEVDRRLTAAGLELTMGGEPTFVLRDDPLAPEWTVAPDGGRKRELAGLLAARLADAFAAGGADPAQPGPVVPR